MKVLILGGSGMLGHKLVQVLSSKFDVWTTLRGEYSNYSHLNIFDEKKVFANVYVQNFASVSRVIKEINPDVIVNAIGVIKQKKDSKDIVKTIEINSLFPHKVAEIASEINARFITLSTDCVFDGVKGNYTELDQPNALDLYGKSKNLGEVLNGNNLTIRTSIIGREIATTKSLIEWFLSNIDDPVKGFRNAIYTGFPTIILAGIIAEVIEKQKGLSGLYHISSDPINKFDLLTLVNAKLKLGKKIEPFDDFKIDRSLDSTKFREEINYSPPIWEELIERMLDDPTPYKEWRKKIS